MRRTVALFVGVLVAIAVASPAAATPESGGGNGSVDVVPSDGLQPSETVTVSGTGFVPNGGVDILECKGAAVSTATECIPYSITDSTDSAGAFGGVPFSAKQNSPNGIPYFDCTTTACGIFVADRGYWGGFTAPPANAPHTAFHHLSFGTAQATTTTTTPAAGASGSATVALGVTQLVRSVTVSPSSTAYGSCTKGGANLTFPNDSCSTPALTVTNTGVPGQIDVHGSDFVPSDGGQHWSLCSQSCGTPGPDQFNESTNASGASTALSTADTCDAAFAQGSCVAGSNQSTNETLALVGPSSSTDSSSQFSTVVTWTAVPDESGGGSATTTTTTPSSSSSQGNMAVSPSSADFGSVAVGSSASRSVTVTNTGTRTWSESSTIDDNVDYVISPSSATVDPGSSATVVVTFRPQSMGAKSATLDIVNSEPGGDVKVLLTGTGS